MQFSVAETNLLDDWGNLFLWLLCGLGDDLVANVTAASSRLRGFLAQIHPHLEAYS